MAMILCRSGEGVFTNGTTVDSGRFGVMAHGETAYLTIEDSTFNTDDTVIQFKSTGGAISVDNSTLTPGNGIILQAMMNDDPNYDAATSVADLDVAFTDMAADLAGDIVNAMYGAVNVTLENTDITGAITTATATSAGTISQGTYYNIGDVSNEYEETGYGMAVTLNGTAVWTVDTTSYLTYLKIGSGASVTGSGLTMTVDGIATPIVPGSTYTGAIVLTVG
jgi:hypothetical protein